MPVSMTELARAVSRVFTDGAAKIIHQPGKSDQDPGYKVDISHAGEELGYRPQIQIEDGLIKLKQEIEENRT